MKLQIAAILATTYLTLILVMGLSFAAGAAHAQDSLDASKNAWIESFNLFCYNLLFYIVIPCASVGLLAYVTYKTLKHFTGRKKQGPESIGEPGTSQGPRR